ncbi:MAG: GNAT family N-acetyltransferase [Deltaproteobacteria bacterium]|nr:GNAT family N-acetyltransferase [Deltaproteobacteria bacterium]
MDLKEIYQKKKISFEDFCDLIGPGNRIFLSSGPATPVYWVMRMLESNHHNLQDLELIQLSTIGNALSTESSKNNKFRLKTFSAGQSISTDVLHGRVDVVPVHFAGIPYIFVSGAIGIDVAVVQTSPPDKRGFLNLGIVMDVADIAIKNASIVVAEVNPNMPVTCGKTSIHIDQVDYLIESNEPIIELPERASEDDLMRIGWHISNLINDDSMVALYIGGLYDAVARHLQSKRGLRIYTHIVSDWIIDLIESGALTFERDMNQSGPVTTSSCFGTRRLYDYVDRNPYFEFVPMMRLSYQMTLMRSPRMVNVMNVRKIDLSAESIVFSTQDNLLAGYERKLNFALHAGSSRGGKSIIALRSTDKEGNSNIVMNHKDDPDHIRSTLGLNHYVVTEYGVASIFGKSIRERALAMIDITHPKHRKQLLEEAKAAGYLYSDQIYNIENAVHYPYALETVKSFKDRLDVKFRPIKPTDEDMMRHLFYQFSDEQKYLRYFSSIRVMPHKEMQKYVNIDYEEVLSLVGIVQVGETEKIIAEGRYACNPNDKSYELAFIVDDDYQGRGIATFLFKYLVEIAKNQGVERLVAIMLPENTQMERVLKHCDIEPLVSRDEDEVRYIFNLN